MLKILTTESLDIVAAKFPSDICRAEGIVIRPVVPKLEALTALTTDTSRVGATSQINLFLAKLTNVFPTYTES